jgi:RNA-directed DNA polymerase
MSDGVVVVLKVRRNDGSAKGPTGQYLSCPPPRKRKSGPTSAKTQPIEKRQVWESWKRIRTGGKGVGVDGLTIAEIDSAPGQYLYPVWNRLASGSYQPPAVREKSIPKGNGKERKLGIPTILDRVAQQVIRAELEPLLEPMFHADSYGYRPGRSAHDALAKCVQRTRSKRYVIDLDIKAFFDTIDHEKLMEMLARYTDKKHILMYCRRWLQAQTKKPKGELVDRTEGTPQGGVISPLLANLYLHEAFDQWMSERFPRIEFERYADDIVIHASSQEQCEMLLACIKKRLGEYKLSLSAEKTKIVYCWDSRVTPRSRDEIAQEFDFLGFTFKPRYLSRTDGSSRFWGFWPGISAKSRQRIGAELRGLAFHAWQELSLRELAKRLAPRIRGWLGYFSRYSPHEIAPVMGQLNARLIKWVRRKFQFQTVEYARSWLLRIGERQPSLFFHWSKGFGVEQCLFRRAV